VLERHNFSHRYAQGKVAVANALGGKDDHGRVAARVNRNLDQHGRDSGQQAFLLIVRRQDHVCRNIEIFDIVKGNAKYRDLLPLQIALTSGRIFLNCIFDLGKPDWLSMAHKAPLALYRTPPASLNKSHITGWGSDHFNVRDWPNSAVHPSIAGCKAENPVAAATGRTQWDGRPHPKRHQCAKVDVSYTTNRGGRHHEDYDNWHRSGKKCVPNSRRGWTWQDIDEKANQR
jgi:hypothetical protein